MTFSTTLVYFGHHMERDTMEQRGRSQGKGPLGIRSRRRKYNIKINVKFSKLFAEDFAS